MTLLTRLSQHVSLWTTVNNNPFQDGYRDIHQDDHWHDFWKLKNAHTLEFDAKHNLIPISSNTVMHLFPLLSTLGLTYISKFSFHVIKNIF